MQDNARIHTARVIKAWFEEQVATVVNRPPYSPDLNPIKHIWKRLKEWVRKHQPELLKLMGEGQDIENHLFIVLQEGWNALPDEYFEVLVKDEA